MDATTRNGSFWLQTGHLNSFVLVLTIVLPLPQHQMEVPCGASLRTHLLRILRFLSILFFSSSVLPLGVAVTPVKKGDHFFCCLARRWNSLMAAKLTGNVNTRLCRGEIGRYFRGASKPSFRQGILRYVSLFTDLRVTEMEPSARSSCSQLPCILIWLSLGLERLPCS